MRTKTVFLGLIAAGGLALGCGGTEEPVPVTDSEPSANLGVKGQGGKGDTSVDAIFLDFEFDGELLTDSRDQLNTQISNQLLYTIGQLNGDRSGSRLDQLKLSDVEIRDDGSLYRVTYHAKLPVAWGENFGEDEFPETYTFRLPRNASESGLEAFTESYSHDCVEAGAHDVTAGSMWYYYRPEAYRCDLAPGDIVEVEASLSLSEVNTTGKYPEYHKIWEDDVFEAVVVVGKDKAEATTTADAGIRSYNTFVSKILYEFQDQGYTTEPADVPSNPGVDVPEVMMEFALDADRSVRIHALLVDDVHDSGTNFDDRYRELSRTADFIVYNGHSGLGSNIRALARKGDWAEGQYTIVFMNGCDTYAYVDSALVDAHAAVNDDDPTGTKYVDIVTNALPAPISWETKNTMAFIRALIDHEQPRTYEQIFQDVNRTQVVLVSGEQDNVYVPDFDDGDPEVDVDWESMAEEDRVRRNEEVRYATPTVPSGRYSIELSGTGDADLYVRMNSEPTVDLFDCRPYRAGSQETCEVELPSAASLQIMVRGWAQDSSFELVARRIE